MYRFAKSGQSCIGCRGFESHPFLKNTYTTVSILIINDKMLLFSLVPFYLISLFLFNKDLFSKNLDFKKILFPEFFD